MYFSKHKHLLSNSIMAVAIIRLFSSLIEGTVRLLSGRLRIFSPDMLDTYRWNAKVIFSAGKVLAITAVFFIAWKKLKKYLSVIGEEDIDDMGRLQEEYLREGHSALTSDTMAQLLQLWAVILVGAETIYLVSSAIYRMLVEELTQLFLNGIPYESYISIYNMSHGFKYLEMLTAILLGVIMTGIFLGDNLLKAVAAVIAVVFLLAFGIMDMNTVALPGRVVGIVWTSVIFHLTETLGLSLLALYLSRKYNGL